MCLFNVIIVVSTFIIYIYTPSFTVLELCITFCYFAPILKRAILYQLSHLATHHPRCVCVCVCVCGQQFYTSSNNWPVHWPIISLTHFWLFRVSCLVNINCNHFIAFQFMFIVVPVTFIMNNITEWLFVVWKSCFYINEYFHL